jgi:hypothetical protein
MNQPIFVTGVERSGSTLIAKIFDICGVFTGTVSTMYENYGMNLMMDQFLSTRKNNLFPDIKNLQIPVDWHERVQKLLKTEGYRDGPWLCKNYKMSQIWPVWNYAYPNARWIIVRRRTGDIVDSCVKTGFMKTFKDPENQRLINVTSEAQGWRWWVHQYEKRFVTMIEAGVNCKIVWPERMVTGDYQQIYEILDWLGLQWDSKIVETIDPLLNKSRRKIKWQEQQEKKSEK